MRNSKNLSEDERIYPFLRMIKPKSNALESYYDEPQTLGKAGIYDILDKGKTWAPELTRALTSGGGAIFPHTYISKCGYQAAAVINACLDSGADQIILLGTFHPKTGELLNARIREFSRKDISNEASWGVLDPSSEKGELLKKEFSLNLFKILWDMEVARRGITPPKLIERYPSLVNGQPEKLPGIQELRAQAKDSLLIGTDDYCHHGAAYGVPKDAAQPLDKTGLEFARNKINEGFRLLEKVQYSEYFDHWMDPMAIGDPSDVTTVMHYLVGSQATPKIVDLKLVDVAPLFESDPSPSWVAATLATIA